MKTVKSRTLSLVFLLTLAASSLPAFGQTGAPDFSACPGFFPAAPPAVRQYGQLRPLCFDGFAVLHSGETKTPLYVAERLNAGLLKKAARLKRHERYYEEARLPESERALLDDYRRSGYSRGHMAPAGDMGTARAKAQSFSLANMVPQDREHNAGPWADIEMDTRRYIRRVRHDVFVVTGPVFGTNPRTVGHGVHVPQALFKLVYDPGNGSSWVHWQENRSSSRAPEPISYEEFVRRTGLRFLPAR